MPEILSEKDRPLIERIIMEREKLEAENRSRKPIDNNRRLDDEQRQEATRKMNALTQKLVSPPPAPAEPAVADSDMLGASRERLSVLMKHQAHLEKTAARIESGGGDASSIRERLDAIKAEAREIATTRATERSLSYAEAQESIVKSRAALNKAEREKDEVAMEAARKQLAHFIR